MIEEIQKRILKLKQDRHAIILAHNYQPPYIQDISDMTGDSLELSREAARTNAEVIVFCGVSFMAETAAILNPDKIVIHPNPSATCPMADMITAEDVMAIRQRHPELPIVTYVNSTASVKAVSTICCTSANSIRVVESLGQEAVYMTPDQNLARYTAKHTDKQIYYWHGYCPIHHNLMPDAVLACKREHPSAVFLAHPECRPEVLDLADAVESTSGMLRYVSESSKETFIIGTEMGILYPMQKANPEKKFVPASQNMICEDMKKTTLDHVLQSLENLQPRITIDENVRVKALKAVSAMLEVL